MSPQRTGQAQGAAFSMRHALVPHAHRGRESPDGGMPPSPPSEEEPYGTI